MSTRWPVLAGHPLAGRYEGLGARQGAWVGTASPYDRLDARACHVMRWRDGRTVEGRDGLFGDDATASDQSWSPLRASGSRYLTEEM